MAFNSDADTLKISAVTIANCIEKARIIIDRLLGEGYALKNPKLLESTANLIYAEYCNLKISMSNALGESDGVEQ